MVALLEEVVNWALTASVGESKKNKSNGEDYRSNDVLRALPPSSTEGFSRRPYKQLAHVPDGLDDKFFPSIYYP